MIRRRLAEHGSLIITSVSGVVIAALLATIAIVSGGYDAQRLDLGDGSIWVANGSQQVIGRVNTEILELDTVIDAPGSEIQVVQDAANVLTVDLTDHIVDVVDQVTAEVLDSVPLPPEEPEVYLANGFVVVHATGTGEIWIVPVTDFADFDSESDPTRTFGTGAVAAISPAGILFVYSPDAGAVYSIDAATGATVSTTPGRLGSSGDDIAITSIAGRWVLLNRTTGQLSIEGRVLALAGIIPDIALAVLQHPTAYGDRILISHPDGLVATPIAEGVPVELLATSPEAALAVAPLVTGDCEYAAWSSGTAWRDCSGVIETLILEDVPTSPPRLSLVQRGDRVALNDPRDGSTWAVQQRGQLIANWGELLEEDLDPDEVEENDQETPPEYETDQVPPTAVDDQFGARPGRASILPVLLNDYDPNGDVLVISGLVEIDEDVGRVDVVNDRQQLQLTLAPAASGSVSIGYTADDGRGGSATATVTVAIRQPDENGAPAQVRPSRTVVDQGGSVTVSVLGDWVDPDGDAFYLAAATAGPPDAVTYKPEGTVVFTEGNGRDEERSVGLVVSDGSATGTGEVTVIVSENPRLTTTQAFRTTYAGQQLTVEPLTNVRGGSGKYRLGSVPTKPGATIETSLEVGTFRFSSDQVRSHFIDYVVTDGERTVTGQVRIDVLPQPDVNATPITIPKTVFVRTQSSKTVDIASSDIDPTGGVLLVTSVDQPPSASGVGVEALDQKAVRITLTAPLEAAVTFGYRVSNGLASADGTVTVVEIPRPLRYQPPVTTDDTVMVRVGDAIDIPVLENDEQPDGEDLTLDPELVTGLPRSAGLLFAAGAVLRYLAPDRTGDFTAVYQVSGPDGQVGQAEVRIAVREAVVDGNAAPVPEPLTARVFAGESVRIPIPLIGTDPDGDSVQFIGQETNPQKGSVIDTGVDYIQYLAGDYSAGTDTFEYTIIDALGARATGTVRVGIAQRTDSPRNPVAVEDAVDIRPGKTVSVRVLANDFDPDGGLLTVTAVEPNSPDIAASIIDGAIIDVTPPAAEGQYGLVYTIENSLGGTSSNFVTVTVVDGDVPPAYPEARDTVLTLSDILDREVIEVDVLRNVFFSDGDVSTLSLSLLPGYDDSATVTARKRISVTVQDDRQIIPFAVANPDDGSRVAYAFVWVPGLADALPQLDRTVSAPSVVSEKTITIDINDYVIAVGGRDVRLTDAASVLATHANGDQLAVDSRTLRYTSADAYFGPASISFEVTDGASASDPDGRRATVVLPITVTPSQNQPPVFAGGVIGFEPGQEKTIDLLKLTTYDNPEDVDELRYTPIGAPPAGFSYRITGAEMIIRADDQARKGTSSVLTVGVRDAASDGQSGRLQLDVVASTRPLAKPGPDLVVAPRGRTTTVDVLANDEATNPFPGQEMRVIGIRGIDGSSLPSGVAVSASGDNRTLAVTVAADAEPVDSTLQYQLADVTQDPDRYVYGSVRVSVQDRPDAPAPPARADGGYEDGQVTLRLTPPVANNSLITNYIVTSSSGGEDYRHDCGAVLRCALADLIAGRRYQFAVTAVNGVGQSDPSSASVELSADYLPAAPASVQATAAEVGGGPALNISWSAVPDPDPGSPVSSYVVLVSGPGVDSATTVGPGQTALSVTGDAGLQANAQYVATVFARNAAVVLSDADWRRTSSEPSTAVGPPSQVAGLTATSIGASGQIQVTWDGSDPNGGILEAYRILRISAGSTAPDCSPTVGEEATSPWVDSAANDGVSYQYVVYARNALFCSTTVSSPVQSTSAPGVATGQTAIVYRATGQYDLQVAGPLTVTGGIAARFEVDVNGRGWVPVVEGQWLTSAQNLLDYGIPLTVSYRGCRDDTQSLCGAASAGETLVAVNVRAGVVSCSIDASPTPVAPQNSNIAQVRYLYQYDTGLGFDGGFVENAVAPPPIPLIAELTGVRVKAAVTIGGEPERVDEGFGEGSCTAQ